MPCWSDDFQRTYNEFLCYLLYFPLSIGFTAAFMIIDIISVPFAYIFHLMSLIQTLTSSDETMDDISEKFERAWTILKFFLFGPAILIASVPVDTFVFYYNLYTEPPAESEDNAPVLSLAGLEVFEVCLAETLKAKR